MSRVSPEATSSERRITAFLDGPDSPDISNPIHSTAVASTYGYRAALVGGVTVYGWTVPAILDVFGEEWLEDGWVDIAFRRPVYPGDEMTARVMAETGGSGSLVMENGAGERCLVGSAGRGAAPWLGDLQLPVRRKAEQRPKRVPPLTLATAPVGHDLRPMPVPFSLEDSIAYAIEKQADPSPRWTVAPAHIHPGWIAARMTPMIHHSYDYGPAIHTRSQVQNMAAGYAGQTVTVAGHFVEAYELKGHHYGVVDGVILAQSGEELARIRHTTIFNVAKRGPSAD
jgi:hypothetical protein